MTRLSVNVNKIATLRNARGGNKPELVQVVKDIENFGAEGITVHPRPDERHIRMQDVLDLSKIVKTEFNIEGYPDQRFMEILDKVRPDQATLVPDPPGVITSNAGWNTKENLEFLKDICGSIKMMGIRCSIFLDPDPAMVESAALTGTDRIELYTESYASGYAQNRERAIAPYKATAMRAIEEGLEINAGHDLDLFNLKYFNEQIPRLKEVSIGHALISDALYYGLENTVQLYLRQLEGN